MNESIYENIYNKLEKLGILKVVEYEKWKASGFMDLNIDVLNENEETKTIALAHNYIQNGDVMADPDMTIRINKKLRTAEALTYQQDNMGIFQKVYTEDDGITLVDTKLKQELNQFLKLWLNNIEKQGHKPEKC